MSRPTRGLAQGQISGFKCPNQGVPLTVAPKIAQIHCHSALIGSFNVFSV
jgi:hypothetical protein